jgi:hypothetical protein
MLMSRPTETCTNRPELAVLAMASAFVAALSFRLLKLSSRSARSLLLAAMLLSIGTVVADLRFILLHRAECAVNSPEHPENR